MYSGEPESKPHDDSARVTVVCRVAARPRRFTVGLPDLNKSGSKATTAVLNIGRVITNLPPQKNKPICFRCVDWFNKTLEQNRTTANATATMAKSSNTSKNVIPQKHGKKEQKTVGGKR